MYRIGMLSLLATLLLSTGGVDLVAQEAPYITKNSEGKEFWLCFMKNFRGIEEGGQSRQNRQKALRLQLFITSSYDARVDIEIEEIGYTNTIDVRANTVVNIQVPQRAQVRAAETAERLAVHIVADTSISVYGLNSRFQTTDTFMGLPVSVLGKEYRAVGYTKLASDLLSEMSIVATEDSTEIVITPTTATSTGRPAGQPFTVNLRRGDVYSVKAQWQSIGPCDLTGTRVVSNKKIAVFSGHNCAYVPPKIEACNHLVEQLPPVSAWGKHYYIGNLKERSKYTMRVIAAEAKTRVFRNSRLVAVLNAGEHHEELNVPEHLQITADKPVLVAQFAQGFKNGDSVGDPMMILISPTQQFLNEYRFATPINGDWHHYVNVVAPTATIREIRLNGRKLDSAIFQTLGESRYSIAQVAIPFGTHVIRSNEPFGLYSYGFGYKSDAYDAYGNMAGQSFFELAEIHDSLPPLADGKPKRDAYAVTFRDDRVFDKGIASIEVVSSEHLASVIPLIEAGAPQITVGVEPTLSGSGGRIVLRATDISGNASEFTVCYLFDTRSEQYTYVLTEGLNAECLVEDSWMVGAYGMLAHSFHSADFSSTGGIETTGTFGESEGFGGGFGVLLGRRLSASVIANARLSVSTMGGTPTSPDSSSSTVFDTASGTFVPYQEATTMSVNAPYLRLGASIQWFPQRFFYLTGGAQVSVPVGSSADVNRQLLRPSNWEYTSGGSSKPSGITEVSSLSTVGFEVLGGLGFSYPVSFHASIFLEALYTLRLNSVVSDQNWGLGTLGTNFGVLWRL